MKAVTSCIVLPICLLTTQLQAQSFKSYVPVNIRKAYEKGTRSWDGKPGPKYWQNRSAYVIQAEFLPAKKLVRGSEDITYYNSSPDTLRELYVRLYPDIYRKGNPRDVQIDPADVTDGVDLVDLTIEGREIDLDRELSPAIRTGTNLRIKLVDPLAPGRVLHISVRWREILPHISTIRTGAYTDSSFFVGYWYPQVAVYDDIDGWDRFNYTGTQEFYNDFNSFDVQITVPNNYMVWATGALLNPEEVLPGKIFERYQTALSSDTVVHVVTASDYYALRPMKSTGTTIWKYRAEHVPDFAFASCKHYLWDAVSIVVDPASERRTLVGAIYPEDSPDFRQVAQIAREILRLYSTSVPGVPFPYPRLTAFNSARSGGMEFPMMVNDGSSTRRSRTVSLTAHETAHSYFPFYMGVNERKYAWMDEGWAVALTYDIEAALCPDSVATSARITAARYSETAGSEFDIPLLVPSVELTGPAYRRASYDRPAVAYALLRDYLGEELFGKALRQYMERWNGKHPLPYDFFFTFNEVAGEDLGWFWKPWFRDFGFPDLSLKEVHTAGDSTLIVVENTGTMPVPIALTVTYEDGTKETLRRSMGVWKSGETTVRFKTRGKPVKVDLGGEDIPDVNKENNTWPNSSPR